MDKDTQNFTPELVDAQIDQLLASPSLTTPDECIVDDLRQMFQDNERSLKRVWERLSLESDLAASGEQQPGTSRAEQFVEKQSTSAEVLAFEKDRHMSQSRKTPFRRALSLIAAACVAALIVGSMLFITNLAHQSQKPAPAAHGKTRQQTNTLPPGVYIGSVSSIYRLDVQSHQVLWQHQLTNITKVVSSGNIIYALLSTSPQIDGSGEYSSARISSVTALDANSGKVLWVHAFPGSSKTTVVATDLVLSQNRLYVGLAIEPTSTTGSGLSSGEVDVLDAAHGKQQAVYAASSGVIELAIGDGVLVISCEDTGVMVYDLANSRTPLWQHQRNQPNLLVFALNIVNNQLYAITSDNNDTVGEGQSFIASYNIQTGALVWHSPIFPGDALERFTVDQNIVYFGTLVTHIAGQNASWTGSIYAYDTLTNRQLWNQPVPGGAQIAPIVNNGLVYVTTDGLSEGQSVPAHVIALTTTNGAIKWQQQLASDFSYSFCFSNGVLYVTNVSTSSLASTPNGLYALNAESGSVLFHDTQVGYATIVVSTA